MVSLQPRGVVAADVRVLEAREGERLAQHARRVVLLRGAHPEGDAFERVLAPVEPVAGSEDQPTSALPNLLEVAELGGEAIARHGDAGVDREAQAEVGRRVRRGKRQRRRLLLRDAGTWLGLGLGLGLGLR